MKYVSLKKIVLVVRQINKKWSFTGQGGVSRDPKGWGWGKIKPCGVGTKIPSFGPAPPHCHP